MGNFWLGYVAGRNGGGGSVPPGLALVAAIFMVFVGILLALRAVFHAIAGLTQTYPFLTLAVVGVLAAVVAEMLGTDREMNVAETVTKYGLITVLLVGMFWAVMAVSGASDFDGTAGAVRYLLMALSFVIVGSFGYTIVTLLRYRCRTSRGRFVRLAGLVSLAWWAWTGVFGLTLSVIPVLQNSVFLLGGFGLTLSVSTVEKTSSQRTGRGKPDVDLERGQETPDSD